MTFLSYRRFREHLISQASNEELHTVIDREYRSIFIYGPPPADELCNLAVFARWETGFACYGVLADKTSDSEIQTHIDDFDVLRAENPFWADNVAYGVVSSFGIEDQRILEMARQRTELTEGVI